MRLLKRASFFGISAFVFVAIATPVLAETTPNVHAQTQTERQAAETRAEQARQAAEQRAAEAKEKAKTRLADAKLKACQNREKTITNIMSRLAERGQKQLNLFTTIANRTEAFYVAKGKTLTNYDTLVADVATKKAAAQTAIDTIKSTGSTFKCDGTDPKGAVSSFKLNLKTQAAALKEYKTAVKNLIVGVKSVQDARSSTDKTTGENQ